MKIVNLKLFYITNVFQQEVLTWRGRYLLAVRYLLGRVGTLVKAWIVDFRFLLLGTEVRLDALALNLQLLLQLGQLVQHVRACAVTQRSRKQTNQPRMCVHTCTVLTSLM